MTRSAQGRWATSRRRFLYLAGLAATGLLATACGGGDALPGQTPTAPSPTTGAGQQTAGAQATAAGQAPLTVQQTQVAAPLPSPAVTNLTPVVPKQFKEAPQLAQSVKDGKLPPVAQRLPKNPVVVKPIEKIGKYGGTWRTSLLGPADSVWLTRTINYETLVRWDPEWKELVPNVAESYQVSPDSKEFTFTLREGHKWSDGQPFSADDILFWYEDTQLNKDLAPSGPPSWLKSAGKPATVTKVDQVTVKFTFPEPSGLFLAHLAAGGGSTMTPKHYLQQFHQKYNPQGIDQLVKDNNVDGWVTLFRTKGGAIPGTPYNAQWYNTDLPTLHGWRVTTPFGAATRFVAERNPFYFKVDPEGNQLPYLDRVNFDIIQEVNVMVLKAVNGEIDMQDRHIGTLPNKAVFTDNQQKGQYRLFEIVPSEMNTMLIFLNLTTKNPVLREVFRNKDFRIGLSHAIDRREIIDVVYVGQGEPWQSAPRRETPFFSERLAKQYTEHDPKKAAEHLDKAFARKDGEGFRLGPDGKRIIVQIEVTTALDPTLVDALNLVKEHWRRVGVDMIVKVEDRALVNTRTGANEHDAYVWKGDAGLKDALINPDRYVPVGGDNFAPAWGTWFLNPTGAGARVQPEEPPAEVKRQQDLYRQLTVTGDEGKRVELMKQILEIAADQFYTLGINLMPNTYGIVRNNFRNVPATMFGSGGPFINPGPTNPSQYFIEG